MAFQKLGHWVSMVGMESKVGISFETSFFSSHLQGFQHQLLLVAIIIVTIIGHKMIRTWRNMKGEKAANETHV